MATVEIQPPIAIVDTPPPKYSAEGRRLFTVHEYLKIGESGVLGSEEQTELIEGDVRLKSPKRPMHEAIVQRLMRALFEQDESKAIVSVHNPLQLDLYNQPDPDLKLIRRCGSEYKTRHPRGDDTLLLIEVSDTSLAYDREVKLPRYAKAGVPELWIVDIENRQIEQYSEPSRELYEMKDVKKIDDEIRSLGSPTVVIQVGKLFA